MLAMPQLDQCDFCDDTRVVAVLIHEVYDLGSTFPEQANKCLCSVHAGHYQRTYPKLVAFLPGMNWRNI